jgi:hypothetical protein
MSSVPLKSDYDDKITKVKKDYFECLKYPRKKKKIIKRELLKEYNFLIQCQSMCII